MDLALLKSLAVAGQLSAPIWLSGVPRPLKSYVDFMGAAALFHAGYVQVSTGASQGRPAGALGEKIDQTAQLLCQIMLKPGERFEVDGCSREPWDYPDEVRVFPTAAGLQKLNEETSKALDRRLLIFVAILAALAGAAATRYFQ